MQKLLVANWKENPRNEAEALNLFRAIAKTKREGVDVVMCPPFIYLEEIVTSFRKLSAVAKKNLALGTQDVFWEERGAFTSEVGPKMLKSLGARYVILGHSERRKYAAETDAMINRKIKLALKDGLRVILCVGEPAAIREQGMGAVERYIKNQLTKDLAGVTKIARGSLAIAYEPIWAIGTGKNDKPEDAVDVARFIKKSASRSPGLPSSLMSNTQFLYGGSVNSKNIADYVQYREIDGALVGGASLKAAEFKKMITIINHG